MRCEWNRFPIYSLNGINAEQWLLKHVIVWLLSWECGTFLHFPSATGSSLSHLTKTKPEFLNLNNLEEINVKLSQEINIHLYIFQKVGLLSRFKTDGPPNSTFKPIILSVFDSANNSGLLFSLIGSTSFLIITGTALSPGLMVKRRDTGVSHKRPCSAASSHDLRTGGSKVVLIRSDNLRRFKTCKCCRIRPGPGGGGGVERWALTSGWLLISEEVNNPD